MRRSLPGSSAFFYWTLDKPKTPQTIPTADLLDKCGKGQGVFSMFLHAVEPMAISIGLEKSGKALT